MPQLDRFLSVLVSSRAESLLLVENGVANLQKDGVARPDIQAKWLENSVIPMLNVAGTHLRRYAAVKFDVGTMDGLLAANQQIDAAMTRAGIPHVFETYEGDHNGKIAERIETKVLPFFAATLAFK